MDGGLTVASPAQTAQAFLADQDKPVRREGYRYAYVLSATTSDYGRRTVGVFLSETDAAEAAELLGPGFSSWLIEEAPIVL